MNGFPGGGTGTGEDREVWRPTGPRWARPLSDADRAFRVVGEVERILFQNRENGYAVFRLKTPGEVITCTGYVYLAQGPGEVLEITGEWEDHPRYGRQLQVLTWNKPVPVGREVAVQVLRQLKGVGVRTARRIVSALGEEAVDLILEQGEAALAGIRGLSPEKIESIVAQLRRHHGVQRVLGKLMALGLSPSTAMRAYRHFGENCLGEIQNNPYRLMEIDSIGFHRADAVARQLGIPETSPFRLRSALLHVLSLNSAEGHCWMDRARWIEGGLELLNAAGEEPVEPRLLEEAAEELAALGAVKVEAEGRVFARGIWEAEDRVARWMAARLQLAPSPSRQFEDLIAAYEQHHGVSLSERQREAVRTAMTNPLLILTGGPGTGKTTTVKAIIWCYNRLHPRARIAVGAPTGRAARRMEEVSGHPAKTLHRLLGIGRDGIPQFGEDRRLPYDLIVVDETSMMDILLMDKLLQAVGPSKLILVGDVDQLPSVGPGHVLHDLIAAGVPYVRLDVIFRQARQSNIVVNAHQVLRGQMPVQGGDFWFIEVEGEGVREVNSAIALRLEKAVKKLLADGYGPDEIQVLSPTKKSELGTEALNLRLQQLMNPASPEKREVRFGRKQEKVWRMGDKVIQMRNDYEKEVFNGEIGYIEDIDEEDGVLLVRFGDALHEYDREEWDQLGHAYAITIHKSQGGEYPVVLIPMTISHYVMLYRNLLYTGITRAKKLCGLIGMAKALRIAVRNNRPVHRNTMLAERIVPAGAGAAGTPPAGDPDRS